MLVAAMGIFLRKHALALLGAFFLTYFITLSLPMNTYSRATFSDTIAGRAYRPFAYRALYPSLIRVTSHLLPADVKASLTTLGKRNDWLEGLVFKNRLRTEQVPAFVIFLGLTVASFYAFFLILRSLIIYFYPGTSPGSADLWMFLALPSMALMVSVYFYVYDPGLWLTFYLAYWLMIRRQWLLFLFAFFLCTFNKESSLLLIPLLYLVTKEEAPKQRMALLLATLAIWVLTFASLRYTYGSNRGSFLEFHLFDQWTDPKVPELLTAFLSTVPWLGILSVYGWKQKPLILRQSLLWTFIPLFLLMLVFGYILEMRDYYESFAFAYLLSIPSMQMLLQRLRKIFQQRPMPA